MPARHQLGERPARQCHLHHVLRLHGFPQLGLQVLDRVLERRDLIGTLRVNRLPSRVVN